MEQTNDKGNKGGLEVVWNKKLTQGRDWRWTHMEQDQRVTLLKQLG